MVVALANAIPKMNDYWFAPVGSDGDEWVAWTDAADLWTGAAGFSVLAGLVLFILLMVWGNQAYRSLSRTGAGGRSWSGWAVGGWFIPLASMVIPRRCSPRSSAWLTPTTARRPSERGGGGSPCSAPAWRGGSCCSSPASSA